MRFCPQFSVRTLAIVVTLIAAYFGAWAATNREAATHTYCYYSGTNRLFDRNFPIRLSSFVGQQGEVVFVSASSSPLPLLICRDEKPLLLRRSIKPRCYYLWLFGPMFKLPYESEWDEKNLPPAIAIE